MRFSPVAAIVLFLTPAGCGGEPAEPAPFSPPPIAEEAFVKAYADAICGRAERCFNLAPHLALQCRADAMEFYADDIAKGVAAGRLVYDAAAAGACVAGIAATACLVDEFGDETLAACFGALQGTIAPGDPCYAPFECAAGFCGGEMTTTCPATCPVALGEGDPCSLITGPSCDARAGLRCSVGVCVRPGGLGAPCKDRNACHSGLVCGGGVCSPLREEHQGCAGNSSCVPGLYCVASGDEGGLCLPRLGEGAKCGSTMEDNNAGLSGTQCADGLVCKGAAITNEGLPVGGACSKPSPLGGECITEPGGLQTQVSGCVLGLECAGGKCALPPSSGPCALHNVCLDCVAFCDPPTNVCVPLKANGEACDLDPECEGGVCFGGACAETVINCHEG